MNSVEEKIWNYIDGNCSPDEQQAMDILIATDDVYKRKYHELSKLNIEFSCMMELDEPSMGFGYKVMETIRTENAMKPLKATIDKRIIKGIAAFFVVSIVTLLVFALINVSWTNTNSTNTLLSGQDIKIPQLGNYLNGTVLKVFILFDIVLALFLADGYLRKKLNNRQTQ
ncbi:hypothetical protein BEL04_12095 [Mucilaginibacter sp. PPCGB 2223]|uniref:hypothetical protein n=1 Tax=Mucilaginibacter sp. PPCGB 2223 TaxID=1886027 RepID=UPI0008253FDA|nr:hypothetical protein [Mucilaginibacter sp. PPCGB 2223]OCX52219.1 hypothetical protein BEL04_12095 [Mucilaginibacter sp. PPCGB 2223]